MKSKLEVITHDRLPDWTKAAVIGALTGLVIFLSALGLINLGDLYFPIEKYAVCDCSVADFAKAALFWPLWVLYMLFYRSIDYASDAFLTALSIICGPLPLIVLGGLIGYAIKVKDDRSCTIDALIVVLFITNILMYIAIFMLAGYVSSIT